MFQWFNFSINLFKSPFSIFIVLFMYFGNTFWKIFSILLFVEGIYWFSRCVVNFLKWGMMKFHNNFFINLLFSHLKLISLFCIFLDSSSVSAPSNWKINCFKLINLSIIFSSSLFLSKYFLNRLFILCLTWNLQKMVFNF